MDNTIPLLTEPRLDVSKKKFSILIVIAAVIILVFIFQVWQFSQGYFSWLKSLLAEINPFRELVFPQQLIEESLEINLSDTELVLTPVKQETQLINKNPLSEIEEKIKEISQQTEKIKREVQKLIILDSIKKEIKAISEKTEILKIEVSKLYGKRTSN